MIKNCQNSPDEFSHFNQDINRASHKKNTLSMEIFKCHISKNCDQKRNIFQHKGSESIGCKS
jgi:hypothetical protein